MSKHEGPDSGNIGEGQPPEANALPASFDPTNLLGNVLGVICDRTGMDTAGVIARFVEAFADDGDFDTAEGRFWDRYGGPFCDDIMLDCGISW